MANPPRSCSSTCGPSTAGSASGARRRGTRTFPFTALVGQEKLKLALCVNAVNPGVGGVLIRGPKGTAKTTAVRALARLLPEQTVVAGCLYGCDPAAAELLCEGCRRRRLDGKDLPVSTRRMRVVELPINASLDRLVGTLDLMRALHDGSRHFQPGLLAEANRNILYVDEVNLLDDHIVDVLLDAAAMGVNIVEREGISISHPSRFVLVGTMNPEEGELRPQLLDRFGLCVDVERLNEAADRVQIAERDALFRSGDACFVSCYEGSDRELAVQLEVALAALPSVALNPGAARMISAHCVEAGVRGHRADVAAGLASRAMAALRGNRSPVPEDVYDALELVLTHRSRTGVRRPLPDGAATDASRDPAEDAPQEMQSDQGPADQPDRAPGEQRQEQQQASDDASSSARPESDDRTDGSTVDCSTTPEATDPFAVREMGLGRLRRPRSQSGKRVVSESTDRRGRYVRAKANVPITDLAVDATVRAAAPHQVRRGRREGDPLRLRRQDLRQKVRERRVGNLTVFVVDASASMDAEQRMAQTKGAILSLLHDAYVRRDRVALVVFKGRAAEVVLPPTSSVSLAQRRLATLSIGGTTPLAHGLAVGYNVIRAATLRDPTIRPLLVLLSDGEGNVPMSTKGDPTAEAQRVAALIRSKKVDALVVDSTRTVDPLERDGQPTYMRMYHHYSWGSCADLAKRMGARYFALADLPKGRLAAAVIAHLKARV